MRHLDLQTYKLIKLFYFKNYILFIIFMMYKNFFFRTAVLILLLFNGALISAQVTIGANKEPQSFSVLELISGDNKGLRLPQIENDEQRDEIFTNAQGFRDNAAALGLQIFNMCSKCIETWNGAGWIKTCVPEPEPHPDYIEKLKCGCTTKYVRWARRNVGAPGTFVDDETDYGMLYQWNSKIGWNYSAPPVSTDGSSWKNTLDGSNTWELENDPCPDGYRIPTQEECLTLLNCGTWTTENGVQGLRLSTPPNDIFLPAAVGISANGNLNWFTNRVVCWSSTIRDNTFAWYISTIPAIYSGGRTSDLMATVNKNQGYALPVRCVKE